MKNKGWRDLTPSGCKPYLRKLRAYIFDIYAVKSYSQEGEDMIMRRAFEGKKDGFYVDVGAHHPKRFSNTYIFYRLGWHGINIEPNPEVVDVFAKERPRDMNLQLGVADQEGLLEYAFFNDPALNSFDRDLVAFRVETTPYHVIATRKIPVKRLDVILSEHLLDQKIDFMTVDVEGLDMAVLRSNDWDKFRPSYVLAESLDTSIEKAMDGEMSKFMRQCGYELFGKTFNTMIFKEIRGARK